MEGRQQWKIPKCMKGELRWKNGRHWQDVFVEVPVKAIILYPKNQRNLVLKSIPLTQVYEITQKNKRLNKCFSISLKNGDSFLFQCTDKRPQSVEKWIESLTHAKNFWESKELLDKKSQRPKKVTSVQCEGGCVWIFFTLCNGEVFAALVSNTSTFTDVYPLMFGSCEHGVCSMCKIRQQSCKLWAVDTSGTERLVEKGEILAQFGHQGYMMYVLEHRQKLLVVHYDDASYDAIPVPDKITAQEVLELEPVGTKLKDLRCFNTGLFLKVQSGEDLLFRKDDQPFQYQHGKFVAQSKTRVKPKEKTNEDKIAVLRWKMYCDYYKRKKKDEYLKETLAHHIQSNPDDGLSFKEDHFANDVKPISAVAPTGNRDFLSRELAVKPGATGSGQNTSVKTSKLHSTETTTPGNTKAIEVNDQCGKEFPGNNNNHNFTKTDHYEKPPGLSQRSCCAERNSGESISGTDTAVGLENRQRSEETCVFDIDVVSVVDVVQHEIETKNDPILISKAIDADQSPAPETTSNLNTDASPYEIRTVDTESQSEVEQDLVSQSEVDLVSPADLSNEINTSNCQGNEQNAAVETGDNMVKYPIIIEASNGISTGNCPKGEQNTESVLSRSTSDSSVFHRTKFHKEKSTQFLAATMCSVSAPDLRYTSLDVSMETALATSVPDLKSIAQFPQVNDVFVANESLDDNDADDGEINSCGIGWHVARTVEHTVVRILEERPGSQEVDELVSSCLYPSLVEIFENGLKQSTSFLSRMFSRVDIWDVCKAVSQKSDDARALISKVELGGCQASDRFLYFVRACIRTNLLSKWFELLQDDNTQKRIMKYYEEDALILKMMNTPSMEHMKVFLDRLHGLKLIEKRSSKTNDDLFVFEF